MKDNELQIDRTCHVLYTKPCKNEIIKKIALHYAPGERDTVWERVQLKYAEFLSDWRTDLGGKKNFHNGKGRHLRLHSPHGVLCRVPRRDEPCGDRGDGGKSVSRRLPQDEIR